MRKVSLFIVPGERIAVRPWRPQVRSYRYMVRQTLSNVRARIVLCPSNVGW